MNMLIYYIFNLGTKYMHKDYPVGVIYLDFQEVF
jgi:hypothetical protein